MSSSVTRARGGARTRGEILRALRSRNYRLFAGANLVSVTGTWMQVVAQNWLVLRLTGHAGAVGATVALQAVPSVVLGVWGGVVADRLPKRRIMLVTQVLLAALAIALAAMTITGVVTITMVYVMALLLGVVMAVDAPSSSALGAELVAEEDLANAIALGSVVNGIGRIVGMSIAGVLVAAVGPGAVFLVNGVSYLVVVAGLLRLRDGEMRTPDRSAGRAGGLRAGLGHVMRTRSIVLCAATAFLVAAFGRNFQVTMAAMSHTVFGTGAPGYGTLSVVFATGALCGGVFAARVRAPSVRLVALVALGAGSLQMMCALAPDFRSFAVAIFPIAIAAVVFDTVVLAAVQLAAGDAHRGRAVAAFGTVAMLGSTAGAPALGWLADQFGGRASLALGGSVVVVGTAGVCAAARALRARDARVPAPATDAGIRFADAA